MRRLQGSVTADDHRLDDPIDELVGLVAERWNPDDDEANILAEAATRARRIEGCIRSASSQREIGMEFLFESLGRLLIEREWAHDNVLETLSEAAEVLDVVEDDIFLTVGLRLLTDRRLLAFTPERAIEKELQNLRLFAPLSEASVWVGRGTTHGECVSYVGPSQPTRRVKEEARRVLAGLADPARGARTRVVGLPITRLLRIEAALVVRVKIESRDRALLLAEEAVGLLGPLLDLHNVQRHSRDRENALVEAGERRLARLGYDLHDGAIQDIAALANDARHFRGQLAEALSGQTLERLQGRVDDLEARLVAVDEELRGISRSLHSPVVAGTSLEAALNREVENLRNRTNIKVDIELVGDLDELTMSQRIATLRVVQEALTNVGQHSRADKASVAVVRDGDTLEARIVDDGVGFEVEPALMASARDGRLGLVGMSERIRLLGGKFDVWSKEGGPTTVAVMLPAWGSADSGASLPRGAPELASS